MTPRHPPSPSQTERRRAVANVHTPFGGVPGCRPTLPRRDPEARRLDVELALVEVGDIVAAYLRGHLQLDQAVAAAGAALAPAEREILRAPLT